MATTTPNSGALHLTETTFQTAISSAQPVLVDFWATWCPPCRILGPTIDQVADATRGTAVVAKLDVDEARTVARQYQIQSIPTLVIFKNGKEVDRMVGVQPRQEIERRLAEAAG